MIHLQPSAKKLFCVMLLLVSSFVTSQAQEDITLCTSDDYSYLFIEEEIRSLDGDTPIIEVVEHVISLRNTEPVGLIFPNNVRVTLYTAAANEYLQVYPVRAAASDAAYQYLQPSEPAIMTSTTPEQNVFNNRFQQVSVNTPQLACDSSRLLATRPVEVLGGGYLANAEEEQRALDTSVTRRTQLSTQEFYTHEMIVISNDPLSEAPSPVSVAQFIFQEVTPFAFQLVQLGESSIDLSVPSLPQASSYTFISNRNATIGVFTTREDEEIQLGTDGTTNRDGYLFFIGQSEEDFFTQLRNQAFFVRPSFATNEAYIPGQFLRLSFTPPEDSEIAAEEFACGSVSPIPGSSPRIFRDNRLSNENVVNAVGDGGAILVNQVDATGRLSVSINGTNYIIDHWLIECNS